MKSSGLDAILEDTERFYLLYGQDDDMLFDIQFDLEREYLATEACEEMENMDDQRRSDEMDPRLWSQLQVRRDAGDLLWRGTTL